jgi:spermidine synthase
MSLFESTLGVYKSSFNGEIRVIKSLAWGTYIQVDGITQSGGVVEKIWKEALRNLQDRFKNILILGLGGGSVAKILRRKFPNSKITGIEIDPLMIEMGRKYLGLDDLRLEIEIADAFEWVAKNKDRKFDLVIVDTYQGKNYPVVFESDDFLEFVKTSLSGTDLSSKKFAVFNRLYTSDINTRKSAVKFGEKLENKFAKVKRIFPLANLVFICQA